MSFQRDTCFLLVEAVFAANAHTINPDDSFANENNTKHPCMHSPQCSATLPPLLTTINWDILLGQSHANRDRPNALCCQFFRLVDSHFRQRHKVGFYAKQLFVSPDHLRQTCKAITGYPPSLFITSRLLIESVQLLSGGGNIPNRP